MLSDTGSEVIRKYGILNTNIPKGHPFYGIPFPGEYLLAANGIVKDKYFLPDYRTRTTVSQVLLKNFGVADSKASATIGAEDVQAQVALSAASAAPGHQVGVEVKIAVAPGWHIYGQPVSTDYVPTSVTFDGDVVAEQKMALPPATPIEFKALGETLPVYQGEFSGTGWVLIKSGLKPGDYKLTGSLKFQECNDAICKIPQDLKFEIPIKIEPMVASVK